MKYEIFVNNPWQENTVILYDETGEAAVIDCGCFTEGEKERVRGFLQKQALKPVLLLNTHLHPDHVMGNGFMKQEYGLEAKASQADEFLLESAADYAAQLGLRGMTPPPPLGGYLRDGDRVQFGHTELQVIAVGGHSPGGLCFYSEADRLLVAGDVLFARSVGRSDLPGGNWQELITGIREKLLVLPEDVKVIPGHGENTQIGVEKRENPFLI